MTDKIVVLNTCSSEEEAESLARKLVEQHLAACVSVVAPVKSFYRWKGEIASDREWLLLIKTSRGLFEQIKTLLESNHTYELPEVIALPIVEGAPNYLAWLDRELVVE